MEYERVKYLLKNYHRTRLAKIQRNLLFLVETDKASLMSEQEIEFAATLDQYRRSYLNEAFGDRIPAKLNPFNEDAEIPAKLCKCFDSSIFFRCLIDLCSDPAKHRGVRLCADADIARQF